MFKNTLNLMTLSKDGENFTSSSIRKKGRSLSQSSFLWTNFVHIPQSLQLPNQKKTLAFTPSFRWSQNTDFVNDNYLKRTDINFKSSQNICFTNSCPDRSDKNLEYANENELPPRIFQDESRTELSSSYKYNPIFPENQFYAENSTRTASSITSYTSLKHHILENIPLDLISNLNILLNKTQKESVISSKSSFCLVNDAISKNQTKFFDISRSNVPHLCRPNPDYSKYFPSTEACQFSSFKNNNQHNFQASTNLQVQINHQRSETNLLLRDNGEKSSLFSSSRHSSPQNQLVVLKPASDSVLRSCSSESIISSLELAQKPSETTLGSEFTLNNGDDLRVHYLNNSASDKSEYSLLISKGYTFVDSTSRRNPSSVISASSDVPEMELQIVNFSDFNLDPPNVIRKQNDCSSNDWETIFARKSKTDLEQEVFKSCHSKMRFTPNSSSSHPSQCKNTDNRNYLQCTSKSSGKVKDKVELRKFKRQKGQTPPLLSTTEENFKRIHNTTTESENIWPDGQNKSLRNTVKKISHRFLRIESGDSCEDDSSSGTYTENVSGKSQFSISEESFEKSYFDDYPLYCYSEETECSEYQSSVQTFDSKKTKKKKSLLKFDFYRKQKGAHCRFIPNLISSQNGDAKLVSLPKRKRKSSLNSSQSILIIKRHHSKHSATTNSTYANSYRGHLKKGVLRRSIIGGRSMKGGKKCTHANIMSTDDERGSAKFAGQSAACFEKVKWFSRDAELTSRPKKKVEKPMNRKFLLDVKNIQSVSSKQEILNFIGRAEMVNLNESTEYKSNNWRFSLREEECPNTTDRKEKTHLYKHYEKAGFGKRNTKPEMDVYSRSDRKIKVLKNERGFPEKFKASKEVKNESSKRVKMKLPHSAEVPNALSATEQKDSFHSCWKENSFTVTEKQAELQNVTTHHYSKVRISSSFDSVSSTLSSSYFSQDKESTIKSSESEQSISETPTEYIKWAQNCIFNCKTKTVRDSFFGLEEKCLIAGENCITGMNTSIFDATIKISEGSVTVAEDKSALSVIPEENGSTEKLKSPFLSQKTSGEITISKRKSSNSQKIFLTPKLVSSSQDSLNDVIFEKNENLEELNSPFSPHNSAIEINVSKCRSSNSQKLFSFKFENSSQESLNNRGTTLAASKNKIQESQSKTFLLSSESEEEYSRFRNELKFYHKNISSQSLPRIIPSSSTFTPDKSVTQIE